MTSSAATTSPWIGRSRVGEQLDEARTRTKRSEEIEAEGEQLAKELGRQPA